MLKTTLYKFQNEGFYFALDRPYSLNLCEMGLGKSLQAIAVADHTESKTLVVCPAFLKRNWQEEIIKHSTLSSYVLGTYENTVYHDADIFITNYEQIKKWKNHIKELNIDFIIADEIHYLKNIKAKRTTEFFDLIKDIRPKRFLGLTGTPIKNRIPDFYSLLKICDLGYPAHKQNMTKFNWWSFAQTFSNPITMSLAHGTVTKFVGVKQINRLREIVNPRIFRRTSLQAIDLPNLNYKNVWLDKIDTSLSRSLMDAYRDFDLKGRITDDGITKTKIAAALYKTQFSAKYAKEILDQDVEALVIFSDHIAPAKKILDLLVDQNITAKLVTGELPADKRVDIYAEFQKGDFQVLVATIRSSSVGINLTKANHIIFNDISWVPSDLSQAQKRIHRMGQEKPCFIHTILMGSFDEMITKTVYSKLSTINRVLEAIK